VTVLTHGRDGVLEVRLLPREEHRGVRLRAGLQSPALGSRELWFEIDAAHAGLATTGVEPFVLVGLLLAMVERRDLRVRGAAVDPILVRNLFEFQRIWQAWFGYDVVGIDAELGVRGTSASTSVVAFSGGVDSAFSAWSNAGGRVRPDRGLRGAVMMHGGDVPLDDETGFRNAAARSRRMVESVGIDFCEVATNAWTLPVPVPHFTGVGVAATLHTLGAGYGAGLIPSTASYADIPVRLNTTPVSDWLLGSSAFEVVHDGARYNRFEKLAFLVEWPEALGSLRVCLRDPSHHRNCGRCHKCMMTIAGFRILGVRPPCFERLPDADDLQTWARTLPSRDFYLHEGAALVRGATDHGLREPWVRTLDRRIRVAATKRGLRAAAPRLSAAVRGAHRKVNALRRR
jgi:hypothetical protein